MFGPYNTADVRVQLLAQGRRDQRAAVFGAEDDVVKEIGEGAGHEGHLLVCRPFGAWVIDGMGPWGLRPRLHPAAPSMSRGGLSTDTSMVFPGRKPVCPGQRPGRPPRLGGSAPGASQLLAAALGYSTVSRDASVAHPSIAGPGRRSRRPGPMMVWDTWRPILRELGLSPNGVTEVRHAGPPDIREVLLALAAPPLPQGGRAPRRKRHTVLEDLVHAPQQHPGHHQPADLLPPPPRHPLVGRPVARPPPPAAALAAGPVPPAWPAPAKCRSAAAPPAGPATAAVPWPTTARPGPPRSRGPGSG